MKGSARRNREQNQPPHNFFLKSLWSIALIAHGCCFVVVVVVVPRSSLMLVVVSVNKRVLTCPMLLCPLAMKKEGRAFDCLRILRLLDFSHLARHMIVVVAQQFVKLQGLTFCAASNKVGVKSFYIASTTHTHTHIMSTPTTCSQLQRVFLSCGHCFLSCCCGL